MSVDDQHDAYILHARPFSDSKLLLEFFSPSLGRVKVMARVPSKKNRGQYQVFQPLMIGVRGSSEIKTLTSCEVPPNRIHCLALKGTSLFCGMYMNELLQRVMPLEQPDPVFFAIYESSLAALTEAAETHQREAVLRCFELELLTALGYQINFLEVANSSNVIDSSQYYRFEPANGFIESDDLNDIPIKGEFISAIGCRNFINSEVLAAAKKITRVALKPLLGNRPIKSRELFF
jgi:DNA repair protein RecO (recombination protein O)